MKQRYRYGTIPVIGLYDPIDPDNPPPPPEEDPTDIPGEGDPPHEVPQPGDGQSKTIMLLVAVAIALFLMTNKNR